MSVRCAASIRSRRCRRGGGRRTRSSRREHMSLRRIRHRLRLDRDLGAECRGEHGADAIRESAAEATARDFTAGARLAQPSTAAAAAAVAQTAQRHRAGGARRGQQDRSRFARQTNEAGRVTERRGRVAEADGSSARAQQQRALSARAVAVHQAVDQRHGTRQRRCSCESERGSRRSWLRAAGSG